MTRMQNEHLGCIGETMEMNAQISAMSLEEISEFIKQKYGVITVCKDNAMTAKEQIILEVQQNKKAASDADYMGDRQEYIYNRGKYDGALVGMQLIAMMLEIEMEEPKIDEE